jgi:hypothetical protein
VEDNVNGDRVYEVTYSQGSLYVGGQFTTAGGPVRDNIAKLDTNTGSTDATFDPNSDGNVFDIVYENGSLYVGGNFTNIGGQARNRIAKLNTSNGNADATFNPDANQTVYDITYASGSLYVGGSFTTIGGQARNRIAKLDTSAGNADAMFAINLDAQVNGQYGDGIVVDSDVLLFGGQFTSPTSRFFVSGSFASATTIPTVGEWSMIVLTLSLFCVAVMYVRKPVLGAVGQMRDLPVQNMQQSMLLGKEDFVFRAKWFFLLSFAVTVFVWSACVYFHETAVRDMVGTGVTGIVGGYLLQLLAVWYFDDAQ